jgi:hypothetical protein
MPLDQSFLLGIDPRQVGCAMEITRQWYRQVIHPDGTSEREIPLHVRNVGSFTCTGDVNFSRLCPS